MGFQREFAEILEEKLGDSPQTEPISTPKEIHSPLISEPFLNFHTLKKSWIPKHGLKSYPKRQVIKPSLKSPLPPLDTVKKPELSWSLEDFNMDWKLSLTKFENLGASIDKDCIKLSCIKTEFRRLAKVLHPDSSTQPNALLFQELKEVYGYLRGDIDKKSKA